MSNRNLILAGTVVLALLIIATAVPADSTKGQSQTQPKTQTQPQTQPQTEVTVRYDVMFQGTFSGLKDPLQQVIQNKKDFEDLWKKHVSVLVPQPPVPEVNFDTSVVVAIAIGEKNTSGYQILIRKVEPKTSDVLIHFHQTEPPANSLVLQVTTQPFVLLRVDKPKGQVQLVKE
ncbi:MAG TPA: protease complex subunit PrcB family protein [Acidobacteriota bacterium]|nr:protease complex subunit PrcB family protein [Acidobacteriota bacterium]